LLPKNSWENNYSLTLQYCLEKGELEYLNSDWEEATSTLELAEKNAQNKLDKIIIGKHKASMYRKKNDLKESLDIAIDALQKLGININAFPNEKEIGDEIDSFIKLSKDLNEDKLYNLVELKDPERIIAMSLLYESFAPAYLLGSPLVAIIGSLMSRITIKEGNCSYSSIGYIFLSAITLANILKDFDNAYKFGNLAIKINDQIFHNKEFEACILDMWGTFVSHHKDPIEKAKKDLLRGFNSGLENGSYQWGVYSGIIYILMSLWGPGTLKDLELALDIILPPSRKVEFHIAQWGYAAKATAYNMKEEVEDRTIFSDKAWPEMHSFMESRDVSTMLVDTTCKISLANWFSDIEKALKYADKGDQYLAGAPGVYFNTVFRFHQALAYTSAFNIIDKNSKTNYLLKIKSILSDFELYAKHNPLTYLHQLLIIKAELQRIDGHVEEAMNLYDAAIDSAKEGGFLHNEAFACELAARFYIGIDKNRIANAYIYESYYAYYKWGAIAKVIDLEKKYPQLLNQKFILDAYSPMVSSSSQQETKITFSSYPQARPAQLDLKSIMKALQMLSSEIVLIKLLKKMMHIVIESAGATHGVLVLDRDKQWLIEAEGFYNIDEITVLQALPYEGSNHVPDSIINYISRTKENVLLSEATREGNFMHDPYIINQESKSILSMPLLNHGDINGILYLENNLTVGAFTEDRLQVINLLASQASISLENARLFEEKKRYAEELIEEVAERKLAEKSLQTTKENLKNTLDISPAIICSANVKTGYFIEANPALTMILGYSVDEITSKPFSEFIHPEDRKDANEEIKKQLNDIDVTYFENRYLHKNGSYKWLAWQATGADKDGKVFAVGSDITERKRAGELIQESNALLSSILESPDNIIMFALDKNYKYLSFNHAHVKEMKHIYGVDIEISKNIFTYMLNKQDCLKAEENYKRVLKGERFIEIQEYGEADSRFWYELIFNPIINTSNQVTGFTVFVTNITGRKLADEQIKTSLKEKELLLKEIHHRVKNNMQVIISLLKLQSKNITDKQYLDMFKESQGRIKSMALVHEKLYKTKSLAEIDFKEYIKSLVSSLFRSYRIKPDKISLKIDVEEISLGLESAIPCGLIINELISNSLKHAFPNDRKGKVSVIFYSVNEDKLILKVSDNGIGVPEKFDIKNTKSLGLHLVTILSEDQLHGKIEFNRVDGTTFQIQFQKLNYKERT
jgi:PAS domain S-box-containing protein